MKAFQNFYFFFFKFLDSQKVFEKINALKAGKVFVVYLHSQNSWVLIRMPSQEQNNKPIISSFQTQLDNKTIMSLNGSVDSLFPQFSFYMEDTDFLKSRSFAELLADLCNQPISESKTQLKTFKLIIFVYLIFWMDLH